MNIKTAIENLRMPERADNIKKYNQVALQVNCDLIEKSIESKYKDLVNVILKEINHKEKCLKHGDYTQLEREFLKGERHALRELLWYIKNNQFEE